MSAAPPTVYTVTQLTTSIRATLEHAFPDVWVEGEVSNLRTPSSGHVYFSLNDQDSQIRAVLFRRFAAALPFHVENGLTVLAKGRVSVYEPRGDYQLLLEYLEPKGIGALQIAFEQLKKRFDQEGLFDPARKRPLPFFPRRVGVITSGTGAALHDIVTVVHRRCPVIRLRVFPVAVQGPGAAREIADAVRLANQHTDLDVLIVGRGGGSWEDLWSFNEEVVVRAIAGSRIPVISAVGHEIDFTLSDFAADYRAPTPSAAANRFLPFSSIWSKAYGKRTQGLPRSCAVHSGFTGIRWSWPCTRFPSLRNPPTQVQRVDELSSVLEAVSGPCLPR